MRYEIVWSGWCDSLSDARIKLAIAMPDGYICIGSPVIDRPCAMVAVLQAVMTR